MANATLTHMIKMAEPLCTMLGMMLVGQTKLDINLMVIMMLVILSALASQPAASNIVWSATGIFMALGSNILYAARNVGSKSLKENSSTTLAGFTNLSLFGIITLLPLLIISLLTLPNDESNLYKYDFNYLVATASISHCMYSFISLAVILAMFDPIQVWPLLCVTELQISCEKVQKKNKVRDQTWIPFSMHCSTLPKEWSLSYHFMF